ncbi:MAG: hypothetical protein HQK84_01945 [Nitrospinae bacterium]|nr:hypothetical protein [Nitrospinota bacterium]
MSDLQAAFGSFFNLSAEEKKQKVDNVSGQISREMLKRLSTYMEINTQLREKYRMSYKEFRKVNRYELNITFEEYKKIFELWTMAHEGIESLSESFMKLTQEKSYSDLRKTSLENQ